MQNPILMYHFIGEAGDPSDLPYYVGVDEFSAQMDFLKKRGFQTIDLHRLCDHLFDGKPIPRRSVVLSFDDGHLSFYKYGFPIMKSHGFNATMFLITSRVGTDGYMDWGHITEMQSHGFSFESHSLTHPIITEVDPDQAEQEISLSKEILEEKLARPIQFYAYRGGHYNDQIQELVKQAYQAAVCSRYGYNDSNSDRYALYRIPVRGSDALGEFAAKLYGVKPNNKLSKIAAQYIFR